MVNHSASLRGLSLDPVSPAGAVLLDRPILNLIPELLSDFGDKTNAAEQLQNAIACVSISAPGKLTHPAQRSVPVALGEAYCKTVCEPRLDPAKIESAGLVVRRIPTDAQAWSQLTPACEAWMKGTDGSQGWFTLNQAQADLDPDPARRHGLGSGSAVIDALYAKQILAPRSESVTPAFVAPPALCQALGKTVVYGIVPTADPQTASASDPSQPSDDDLQATVPLLLKSGSHHVPSPGETITSQYSSSDWLDQQGKQDFKQFLALVQAAVVLYGIFDDSPSAEASTLLSAIQEIQLTNADGTPINMGDLLKKAAPVLVGDRSDDPSVPFPMPVGDYKVEDQAWIDIFAAIKTVLARAATALTPQVGRFDDTNRLYFMRMFIRVKDTPQCPPKLVWAEAPAGPFQIAPWYEPGNQPPVHIPLPDPTDRALLKQMKPNVSFGVPGALQQMMQAININGLMSGSGGGGGSGTVNWICAFSIPIVTICAFIVLSIFLMLLNILFFWLPFVKICIPVKK